MPNSQFDGVQKNCVRHSHFLHGTFTSVCHGTHGEVRACVRKVPSQMFAEHCALHVMNGIRNDNDNDNDTLREVRHPSNEGLALQARV